MSVVSVYTPGSILALAWDSVPKITNSGELLMIPALFSLPAMVLRESPTSTVISALRSGLFSAHISLASSQPIPAISAETISTNAM